ncbi:hypothetical protein H5410_004663, partial [Solanum commersonii]
ADFAELLLDLGFSRREVDRLNFKFLYDVAKYHFLMRLVECVVNFYTKWTIKCYDVAKNHFLTRLVECVVNFYARWTIKMYATKE